MPYLVIVLLVVTIAVASYRTVLVIMKGDDRSLSVCLQGAFSGSVLAILLWLAKLALDMLSFGNVLSFGNYKPEYTGIYWFVYAGVPALLGGVAAIIVTMRQRRSGTRASRG